MKEMCKEMSVSGHGVFQLRLHACWRSMAVSLMLRRIPTIRTFWLVLFLARSATALTCLNNQLEIVQTCLNRLIRIAFKCFHCNKCWLVLSPLQFDFGYWGVTAKKTDFVYCGVEPSVWLINFENYTDNTYINLHRLVISHDHFE